MSPAGAALLVLGAYALGAVPFGLVLTRLFTGKDVRQVGSGNIGASNAARAAGKGVGVLTLVLDAAKAALPMLLASHLATGAAGSGQGGGGPWGLGPEGLAVAVGLAAFLGHLFPVWLRFRGGKGVATGFGVFLVLAPWPALAAFVLFAAAYGATRITAVGSLAGAATCCVGAFVQELGVRGRAPGETAIPWAGLLVTLLVFARHRGNLARMLRGTENRV